jgi:hypothetical protein
VRAIRVLRAIWEILRVVLGPTKAAPLLMRWWPIAVAALGIALPLVGLTVPGHLTIATAWWLVIALSVLVLLCFRAAWILHAAISREFPRAEMDVKPWICIRKHDADVELDTTVLFFQIRVTNREPTRRLNLVFDMSLRWPMGDNYLSFKLYPARDDRLKSHLEEPVAVDPQHTVSGELLYSWDWGKEGEEDRWIEFIPGGHMFRPKRDGSDFILNVHDYVSGGTVTMTCPGKWSSPETP